MKPRKVLEKEGIQERRACIFHNVRLVKNNGKAISKRENFGKV